MCTLSWLRSSTGYELFCNRDEARSRARAHAPERREIVMKVIVMPDIFRHHNLVRELVPFCSRYLPSRGMGFKTKQTKQRNK